MTTWEDVRKAVKQASVDTKHLSEVEQPVETVKKACVLAAMNGKVKIEPIIIQDKKVGQDVVRILAADGWPVKSTLNSVGLFQITCNLPNAYDEKLRSTVFQVPYQAAPCSNMMDIYISVNRWLSKNIFRA